MSTPSTRTAPDDELRAVAAEGKLVRDRATLLAQTERLLDHPHAERRDGRQPAGALPEREPALEQERGRVDEPLRSLLVGVVGDHSAHQLDLVCAGIVCAGVRVAALPCAPLEILDGLVDVLGVATGDDQPGALVQ